MRRPQTGHAGERQVVPRGSEQLPDGYDDKEYQKWAKSPSDIGKFTKWMLQLLEQMADKNKRFTQVEMKFFSMWWDKQTDQKKEDVR